MHGDKERERDVPYCGEDTSVFAGALSRRVSAGASTGQYVSIGGAGRGGDHPHHGDCGSLLHHVDGLARGLLGDDGGGHVGHGFGEAG